MRACRSGPWSGVEVRSPTLPRYTGLPSPGTLAYPPQHPGTAAYPPWDLGTPAYPPQVHSPTLPGIPRHSRLPSPVFTEMTKSRGTVAYPPQSLHRNMHEPKGPSSIYPSRAEKTASQPLHRHARGRVGTVGEMLSRTNLATDRLTLSCS